MRWRYRPAMLVILLSLLPGCATVKPEPPVRYVCGNEAVAEELREGVKARLRDNLSDLLVAYHKTLDSNLSDAERHDAELHVREAMGRLKMWSDLFGADF